MCSFNGLVYSLFLVLKLLSYRETNYEFIGSQLFSVTLVSESFGAHRIGLSFEDICISYNFFFIVSFVWSFLFWVVSVFTHMFTGHVLNELLEKFEYVVSCFSMTQTFRFSLGLPWTYFVTEILNRMNLENNFIDCQLLLSVRIVSVCYRVLMRIV